MGKCQCTSTDICLAVSTLTPLPPGFSISLASLCGQLLLVCAAAINPLYALIVCVVHRAHFLCRLLLQLQLRLLATGRCWHFRCPGAKSSNAVCCSPPSGFFSSFLQRIVVSCLLHTNAHHADGHTQSLAAHMCMCVCCYAWVVVPRTLPPSLTIPLPILIADDAKGDNVKRQLFETISTHCRRHTQTHSRTQPSICRLG